MTLPSPSPSPSPIEVHVIPVPPHYAHDPLLAFHEINAYGRLLEPASHDDTTWAVVRYDTLTGAATLLPCNAAAISRFSGYCAHRR